MGTDHSQRHTPQYQNKGLIVACQQESARPNVGTTGADRVIRFHQDGSAAMQIQYVTNVTIAANTFPLFDGLPDYCTDTPVRELVLQAYESWITSAS